MASKKHTNRSTVTQSVDDPVRNGEAILKLLAPGLQQRGVPKGSYIIVNTASGEFVTGKTEEEAGQRFALLHPGTEGWMQRMGDIIGDSDLTTDVTCTASETLSQRVASRAGVGHTERNRHLPRRECKKF